MDLHRIISHDSDTPSINSSTTFMHPSHCYTPPPPPPASRRNSSATDISALSSNDSCTDMTTPRTSTDYKCSPTFPYDSNSSLGSINDLANAASTVIRSHGVTRCVSPTIQHHAKAEHQYGYNLTTRRSQSFDGKAYSSNAYAPPPPNYSHQIYLSSVPYPQQRQRAQSSPNTYSNDAPYSSPSPSYYPPSAVPHSPPVFRSNPSALYSSPPTPQDRRKAHILSEQKRRESINSGFGELKQQVTSPRIARAISMSSRSPGEFDADSKHEANSTATRVLGGGGRESKAAVLRKACKVIDDLADKIYEMKTELDLLRSQAGKPPKKGRHSKRGSRDVPVFVADAHDDDDMKMEDAHS